MNIKNIYKKYKVVNKFFAIQLLILTFILCSMFVDSKKMYVVLYFMVLILCVISYFSLYKIYKNANDIAILEAEATLYETQQQIQKEHLNAMKESHRNVNECKEELHALLNRENITVKDEQEARVRANELMEKYSSLYSIDYCQNKIIDAILYNKILWAKTLGIKITTKIIVPEIIQLEDIDLMFLFTNLIDNAVEACTKVDKQERFIDIEGMIKANYLIVRVSNSKDTSVQLNTKTIRSTKEDSERHGLGIQILKQVCKKNNGKLKIEDNGTNVNIYATLSLLDGVSL